MQPIPSDSVSWWHQLTGELPEQDTKSPRTGQFHQTGPYNGGQLQLSGQPGRIDWTLAPEAKEIQEFPTIGAFEEARISFHDLMHKWLLTASPAARIALGVTLILPVESRDVGYRTVLSLTHLKQDIFDATDLLFQINRPRQSSTGIPNLRINRLSTWSVARLQRLQLQLGSAPRTALSSDQYACRLQLDINTSPEEVTELNSDQMGIVFDELVKLALEISIKKGIAHESTDGSSCIFL